MQIKLKINTAYGKIGDTVTVSPSIGSRLIATGQAEAVSAEPRAAGRAKKLKIDNKAVGA